MSTSDVKKNVKNVKNVNNVKNNGVKTIVNKEMNEMTVSGESKISKGIQNAKNSNINLIDNLADEVREEKRQNSIFFEMGQEPQIVVIMGLALRMQEFKNGESLMVDIKLATKDGQIKITGIPKFAKFAFQDMVKIMQDNQVVISSCSPNGVKANLRDYKWVGVEIPVILKPNVFNGKTWVGRVNEVDMDLAAGEIQKEEVA